MMAEKLTREDVGKLRAPFPAKYHKFLQGMAYIQEWASADRIEEVDPAWSMRHVATSHRANEATGQMIVSVTVEMKIKGSVRIGVGSESVKLTKPKKVKNVVTGKDEWIVNEANEAEKSAATDAFKRACRMFGMGRYLLRLPSNVKNEQQLQSWFESFKAVDGRSELGKVEKPDPTPRKVNTDGKQAPQQQAPTEKKLSTIAPDSKEWMETLQNFNSLICVDDDGKINDFKARGSWKKISDDKHSDYLFGGTTNILVIMRRMLDRRCQIDYGFESTNLDAIAKWAEIDDPAITTAIWREWWVAIREVANSGDLLESVLDWDLEKQVDKESVPF